MTKNYFLFDDGIFDYQGIVEPTSENQLLGYKAIAWNTTLQWTGWWQDRNVIGMSTTDPLFNPQGGNVNDISQAVQIGQKWNAGTIHPWIWEAGQGQADTFNRAIDAAIPISYGTNLQQSNFYDRWEDTSYINPEWGHGQRLWIQTFVFDNKNPARPMEIYFDPYTEGRDIVVNVPIIKGTYTQFFDFSKSEINLQTTAWNDLKHVEVNQTRQQFTDLLIHVENFTGIDLQNESGWWSLMQAGYTSEMASIPANDWRSSAWGIGDHGAMQTAMMNMEVWDG
jgi:hypothetical protein